MSGWYEILPKAMQILGARSVAVFSIATGSKIWSVTEKQQPIDDDVVAAVVDAAAAAQRLVAMVDPGSPLDEILAVDGAWFHLLHLLAGRDTEPRVAHLVLDRGVANLAQSRREFRDLVEAERAMRRTLESPTVDARVALVDAEPVPSAASQADLPQRNTPPPVSPKTPTGDSAGNSEPSWREHFAGPFMTDVPTLQRILDALRRL